MKDLLLPLVLLDLMEFQTRNQLCWNVKNVIVKLKLKFSRIYIMFTLTLLRRQVDLCWLHLASRN